MAQMFSKAEAYERFMGRWSRRLAASFVRFAGVGRSDLLLDVGCATGSLTRAALAEGPSVRVIGVDRSPQYLSEAHATSEAGRARFAAGDACGMPFRDRAFDRALSLLVVNFVPDPGRAVREMARVTRDGGIVAAAVWDYGKGMEMLRVFWDEAVALDPAADALDEKHMPLCRHGELEALWHDAGLSEIDEEALAVDLPFASFDDFWVPFTSGQGPAGHYASLLPDARAEELRSRLRARLLGGGPDRPFTLPASAWAVRGVRS